MNIKQAFAVRVKEIMTEKSITFDELLKKSRVIKPTLQNMLNEKSSLRFSCVFKVINALGYSKKDFFSHSNFNKLD